MHFVFLMREEEGRKAMRSFKIENKGLKPSPCFIPFVSMSLMSML